MTPTQLDHLRRIDAHLANLLSTAEKRTPGEWSHHKTNYAIHGFDGGFICKTEYGDKDAATRRQENAIFIAACAGNAEAGWRATRAAIALCIANLHTDPEFPTHEAGEICDNDGQGCRACGYTERILLQSILAAFPNI